MDDAEVRVRDELPSRVGELEVVRVVGQRLPQQRLALRRAGRVVDVDGRLPREDVQVDADAVAGRRLPLLVPLGLADAEATKRVGSAGRGSDSGI